MSASNSVELPNLKWVEGLPPGISLENVCYAVFPRDGGPSSQNCGIWADAQDSLSADKLRILGSWRKRNGHAFIVDEFVPGFDFSKRQLHETMNELFDFGVTVQEKKAFLELRDHMVARAEGIKSLYPDMDVHFELKADDPWETTEIHYPWHELHSARNTKTPWHFDVAFYPYIKGAVFHATLIEVFSGSGTYIANSKDYSYFTVGDYTDAFSTDPGFPAYEASPGSLLVMRNKGPGVEKPGLHAFPKASGLSGAIKDGLGFYTPRLLAGYQIFKPVPE